LSYYIAAIYKADRGRCIIFRIRLRIVDMLSIGYHLLGWIRVNWALLLIVTIIAGAFVFLRSTPSPVSTLPQLNGLLAKGRPTVIEFYSNF
jgi:hypothetical protein